MKFLNTFIKFIVSVAKISVFYIGSAKAEIVTSFLALSNEYNNNSITADSTISIRNDIAFVTLNSPTNTNLRVIEAQANPTSIRHALIGQNSGSVFQLSHTSITFRTIIFKEFSKTGTDGGVFNLAAGSKISFGGNVDFTSNTAKAGGAIYTSANPEDPMYLKLSAKTNETIKFIGNASISSGGAIAAYTNSDIFMDTALNGSIQFIDNSAWSGANDIFLGSQANLFINTLNNSKVEMSGGIQGSPNSKIEKTGTGDFLLGGITKYKGSIEVKGGTIAFQSNTVSISTLTVSGGNLGIYIDNLSLWTTTSLIETEILNLNSGKLLVYISTNSIISGGSVPVIKYSQLNGTFSNLSEHMGIGDWRYSINYSNPNYIYLNFTNDTYLQAIGLNHNQSEAQNALNAAGNNPVIKNFRADIVDSLLSGEQAQRLFGALSGSFLVDAIRSAQINNNSVRIYNRISQNSYKDARPVWAQIDIIGANFSDKEFLDKFSFSGVGALFGMDLFEFDKNKLLGAYISYSNNSFKQGADKGDVDIVEIGGYGAIFSLYDDKLIIKGNAATALQMFDTQREVRQYANAPHVFVGNPKASFNAYAFTLGAEAQYEAKEYDGTFIAPFLGLQTSLNFTPEIQEESGGVANLTVDRDAYLRMQTTLGAKIYGNKDKFHWYGRWYLGFLLVGSHPQYDIKFSAAKEAGSMNIYGNDEGAVSMGFGAGGEYIFNEIVSAFANIDANFAGNSSQYFVSLGLSYKFDLNDKEKSVRNADLYKQEPQTNEQEARIESVEETIDEQEYMNIEDRDITPDELDAKKQEAVARRQGVIIKSFILKNTFPSSVYRIETDAARQEIEEIADFIKEHSYRKVTIEGHTDSSGSEIINQRLSRMRARSVFEELFKEGIDVNKMEYIGFGSALPAATNATIEGKDKNRRVEIFVE
ncbi:MAG: autotransporter domain-containing protein [Endomicrobium sp.]|nr:autotransporter domain-containing protein [Endomicrobium sp.]